MSPALFLSAQLVTMAGGIPQAVPPTAFACDMTASDGSRFQLSGTTPLFPKGSDPNGYKDVTVAGNGPQLLLGRASVSPGDASDWFREFQVQSRRSRDEVYFLQLKLRRDGTSVAYSTVYRETGKPIPYDYHAAGLCKADFAPRAEERG